jgi:nucleoside-diphosphate-sugar epimerase
MLTSASTPYQLGSNPVLQFIHVTDLAEMAAELGLRGPAGETFHLAGPDAISWAGAQKLMARLSGRRGLQEEQGAAIERYRCPFDMAKARAYGVAAAVGMRAGLIELAAVAPPTPTPTPRDRWVPAVPGAQHLYQSLRRPLRVGGRSG